MENKLSEKIKEINAPKKKKKSAAPVSNHIEKKPMKLPEDWRKYIPLIFDGILIALAILAALVIVDLIRLIRGF